MYQAVDIDPDYGLDFSINASLTHGERLREEHYPKGALSLDDYDTDAESPPDDHMYKKFTRMDGLVFVALSAVSLGLGNSLDSMSTLSMFHPFLLVCGLEVCADKLGIFYTLIFILLTQAAGTTLGFASLFGTISLRYIIKIIDTSIP